MNIKKMLSLRIADGKPDFPGRLSVSHVVGYAGKLSLFAVLYAASWLYRGIVQVRVALYRRGMLPSTTLSCPVISIGNITTGGTGKTPMVILAAQILRQHGKRVTVLSRGYRRKNQTNIPVIIPAGGQNINVETVGDEPLLIARRSAGIPAGVSGGATVIVGSNRAQSGQLALEHIHPDVLLLDDGFQHIQLSRTCDIVLIDATNPFGGGYLLPAGFLREPLENLYRAQIFVMTRSNEVDDLASIRNQLHQVNPDAHIFTAHHAFAGIRNMKTGDAVDVTRLSGQRALAVCGLANPASFHRLLEGLKIPLLETLDFPDHHWFSEQDIAQIRHVLSTRHLDTLVTTEKDEARLNLFAERLDVTVYIVAIALKVEPAREFEELLLAYSRRR